MEFIETKEYLLTNSIKDHGIKAENERTIMTLTDAAIYLCTTIKCQNCPVNIYNYKNFDEKNFGKPCVSHLLKWIIEQSKNREVNEMKETVKYEVVVAIPDVAKVVKGTLLTRYDVACKEWMKHAKDYYNKTKVYVSAIANEGRALYNKEWGCPNNGEYTITFNCTLNPNFIPAHLKDEYENGVIYIAKQLKKQFEQHTVTITRIDSKGSFMKYLTDENCKEDK